MVLKFWPEFLSKLRRSEIRVFRPPVFGQYINVMFFVGWFRLHMYFLFASRNKLRNGWIGCKKNDCGHLLSKLKFKSLMKDSNYGTFSKGMAPSCFFAASNTMHVTIWVLSAFEIQDWDYENFFFKDKILRKQSLVVLFCKTFFSGPHFFESICVINGNSLEIIVVNSCFEFNIIKFLYKVKICT